MTKLHLNNQHLPFSAFFSIGVDLLSAWTGVFEVLDLVFATGGVLLLCVELLLAV